jgi:four helix bundle protein
VGSDYNQLVAYRLSIDIGTELHRAIRDWSGFDRNTVGLQMIRAIDSVGANIAEGMGRWTKADRRRCLLIARGSLYETEHWINCARRRGLLTKDLSGPLAEAARTLNGLIRKSL